MERGEGAETVLVGGERSGKGVPFVEELEEWQGSGLGGEGKEGDCIVLEGVSGYNGTKLGEKGTNSGHSVG